MPVHYTPASLRSLKARLRPFTQPNVLGGLAGLSAIAFGCWMYANRVDPSLLSLENLKNFDFQSWFAPFKNAAEDELPADPADASATAADIESSDVLKQLLGEQTPPATAPKPTKEGQPPAGIPGVDKERLSAESILQRLSGTTTGAAPQTTTPQTLTNPAIAPSISGLSTPLAGSPSGSIAQNIILGTGGYGSANAQAANPTAPPTNALQAAFDRSRNAAATATPPQTTSDITTPLSSIPTPGEPLPPPPNLPSASATSTQPLPILPLTSTTGVGSATAYPDLPTTTLPSSIPSSTSLVPVSPKPITASPLPSPLPVLPPAATSNYDYNYGSVPTAPVPTTPYTYTSPSNPSPSYPTATPQTTVQPLPTQSATPYSVDNPIPGRVLGGGEINTFGNP